MQADPDFINSHSVNELTTTLHLDQSKLPRKVDRAVLTPVAYYVRRGTDTRRFFIVGRVFAMLHTEPAGAQSSAHGNDDAYSYVKFNEVVYSQIRRFIVVDVRQGFVYAWYVLAKECLLLKS